MVRKLTFIEKYFSGFFGPKSTFREGIWSEIMLVYPTLITIQLNILGFCDNIVRGQISEREKLGGRM